jgi:hypothetical protein
LNKREEARSSQSPLEAAQRFADRILDASRLGPNQQDFTLVSMADGGETEIVQVSGQGLRERGQGHEGLRERGNALGLPAQDHQASPRRAHRIFPRQDLERQGLTEYGEGVCAGRGLTEVGGGTDRKLPEIDGGASAINGGRAKRDEEAASMEGEAEGDEEAAGMDGKEDMRMVEQGGGQRHASEPSEKVGGEGDAAAQGEQQGRVLQVEALGRVQQEAEALAPLDNQHGSAAMERPTAACSAAPARPPERCEGNAGVEGNARVVSQEGNVTPPCERKGTGPCEGNGTPLCEGSGTPPGPEANGGTWQRTMEETSRALPEERCITPDTAMQLLCQLEHRVLTSAKPGTRVGLGLPGSLEEWRQVQHLQQAPQLGQRGTTEGRDGKSRGGECHVQQVEGLGVREEAATSWSLRPSTRPMPRPPTLDPRPLQRRASLDPADSSGSLHERGHGAGAGAGVGGKGLAGEEGKEGGCGVGRMGVRVLVGLVYLSAMLPLCVVTGACITLVLFVQGVGILLALLPPLPPEPRVLKTGALDVGGGGEGRKGEGQGQGQGQGVYPSLPGIIVYPRSRPRIFFDGAGWGFSFALGVASHLVRTSDFGSELEVIGVSSGNIAAICLLLGYDPVHVASTPPLDRRPSTLDPRPQTLDPRPQTLDPRPQTLEPKAVEPKLPLNPSPYPLPSSPNSEPLS